MRPSSSRRQRPALRSSASLHPLEHPQARRLPGRRRHPSGEDRAGAAAPAAGRGRRDLPADQDLEGIQRLAPGRQARSHRARARPPPGPHVRVRRVRVTRHPPGRRLVLGTDGQAPAAVGELPQVPRGSAVPCLLLVGDDELWGVLRERKSGANTIRALQSIRARRPDGDWIYVILDNLSAHKGPKIRTWAWRNKVELCFTPTYSSWRGPRPREWCMTTSTG